MLNRTQRQWVDLGFQTEACMTRPETCDAAGGTISLWVNAIECPEYAGIVSSYAGNTSSMVICAHSEIRYDLAILYSEPIYTKHQCQCCGNTAMTLAILFSLKSVELLENGLQTYSGVTPLFSMRTESQVSSQSCHSIDADAWCKWALTVLKSVNHIFLATHFMVKSWETTN